MCEFLFRKIHAKEIYLRDSNITKIMIVEYDFLNLGQKVNDKNDITIITILLKKTQNNTDSSATSSTSKLHRSTQNKVFLFLLSSFLSFYRSYR